MLILRQNILRRSIFSSILTTVLLYVLLAASALAQDAQFSQFYSTALYLNPAMAGYTTYPMFVTTQRVQWRHLVTPYQSNQISVIKPLIHKKGAQEQWGGAGLSVFNDKSGDGHFSTLGVNGNFAYNVAMTRSRYHFMTFGMQLGFVQKTIDYTNLQWGSQYNPYIGFDATAPADASQIVENKLYMDVGAGFIYSYNSVVQSDRKKLSGLLGVSAYHLNRPNESMIKGAQYRVPLLLKMHGGINFRIGDRLILSPNAIHLMQNGLTQTNVGGYARFILYNKEDGIFSMASLMAGGWYRLNDAYILTTGVELDWIAVAFSYDMTNSTFRYLDAGKGGYEISILVKKPKPRGLLQIRDVIFG